ncbi:MAG: helix-turn-helix transcriptional regulator [Prevotellaceae bacterium]|nr:helix-turn-helix transcriptional regulator [Prevotellaceae bacterium]
MGIDTFSKHIYRGNPVSTSGGTAFLCRLTEHDTPFLVHRTSAFLLLYCMEGDAEIVLDNNEYSFLPNAMIVCRADDTMSIKALNECIFLCAIYNQEYLSNQFHYNEEFYPYITRIKNGGYMVLDAGCSERFKSLATCAVCNNELATDSDWAKGSMVSSMKALLCMAMYWIEMSEKQNVLTDDYSSYRAKEIFNNFIKLISENYMTERRVYFYASRLCITPKYLSRIVHEKSGKTASRMIKEAVLREINYLLKNTTLSIKEISNTMNFPNASFFCKYFKNEFGISPNRYRES